MKRLVKVTLIGLLAFSGCSVNNLTKPSQTKPKIDKNLPVIDSSSLKALPQIKRVTLEWKGVDKANSYGYYIYRSNFEKNKEKLHRIADINNRYASHYLDKDAKANTTYLYAISVKGKQGSESVLSKAIKVRTYPVFNSVSFIQAISDLPRMVKIIWRPHGNLSIKKYIIERKSLSGDKWSEIATLNDRLYVEYFDINLKDSTTYSYRIKSVSFDGIVSNPSKVVTATTRALPKGGLNLTASQSLPRKITLHWQESNNKYVASYNIYRSDSANGFYNKIASIPLGNDTYEDRIDGDGVIKFYKITTVDKDGLETKLNSVVPVMGKTLNKPAMPTITLALIKDDKVILNWSKGDARAVSYNIYKVSKKGFLDAGVRKVFKNITNLRFEDPDIVRGTTYKYYIEAVDANGLVSKQTDVVVLTFPKLQTKEIDNK